MVIVFLLIGLAVLCVFCKTKGSEYEGMTPLPEDPSVGMGDEIEQSSIEIIEPEDTFTTSPGFGSGPGTIGFGRAGSDFGN